MQSVEGMFESTFHKVRHLSFSFVGCFSISSRMAWRAGDAGHVHCGEFFRKRENMLWISFHFLRNAEECMMLQEEGESKVETLYILT